MTTSANPASARATSLEREAIHHFPDAARRNPVAAYAISIGLTLAAFAVTLLLQPFVSRAIFLAFWPAIIATAWFAGFRPAMVASVGAVLLVDYFLIDPPRAFNVADAEELVTLVAFLLTAGFTSWAVSLFDRARSQAAQAARDNAELVGKLDQQSAELSQQLEESQAMAEELELSAEELSERTAQAEAAEKFSRGILESISDPFVVQDSEWRFRYINEAAARVLLPEQSDTPEKLIGKSVWDVYPDIVGTSFEREMRRAALTRNAGKLRGLLFRNRKLG